MSVAPLFATNEAHDLDQVMDSIGDAVCVSDKNMVFVAANRRFANFYGLSDPNEVIGKHAFDVYPGFERSVFYQACRHTVDTGETASRVGYSSNLKTWIVMRCCSISDTRFAMIVHPIAGSAAASGGVGSLIDELTSLPNRMSYDLDNAALGGYAPPAVAVLDISHFKQVNETLGAKNGDRVLMEVGARMLQALGQSDRAYRLGGDRFLVMGTNGPEALTTTVRAILARLTQPMLFGGVEYVLRFNIGLASSDNGDDPELLLPKAEQALSRAKTRKTGWEQYQPGPASAYDLAQIKALQEGLERREMVLFLQPQVDMVDGTVVGAEALVRWNHPDGMRGPGQFLPLVEEAGLSGALDIIVLDLAFEILVDWHKRGVPLQLSVNLSSMSVGDMDTIDHVRTRLERSGVDPKSLCLEITEGALIHDVDASQKVIEGLKQLGVEIALDDFGTGYCSMAYLIRYPSHYLKIDRSFVQEFDKSEIKQITVKNIIALAHGLGIAVVAEGVETSDELEVLRAMSCDITQGYVHAKPMSAVAFEHWAHAQSLGRMSSSIQ